MQAFWKKKNLKYQFRISYLEINKPLCHAWPLSYSGESAWAPTCPVSGWICPPLGNAPKCPSQILPQPSMWCSQLVQQLVNVIWEGYNTVTLHTAKWPPLLKLSLPELAYFIVLYFQVPDGIAEKQNKSSTTNNSELHLQQIHIHSWKSG